MEGGLCLVVWRAPAGYKPLFAHVFALLEVDGQHQEGGGEDQQHEPGKEQMPGIMPVETRGRGWVQVVPELSASRTGAI